MTCKWVAGYSEVAPQFFPSSTGVVTQKPPYCVHFLLDPSVFSFVTQSESCYTRKWAATRVKTFQAPNKIKFFNHCSLFECPKEKKTGIKITEKCSLCRFERNRAWKRNVLSHRHKFSVYRMLLKSWFLFGVEDAVYVTIEFHHIWE